MSARVGIKAFIRHVRAHRGEGYSIRKINNLIATAGMPAYRDPDHLNAQGEPVLKFDLDEWDAWWAGRLVRVNPAPLPNVAPLRPSTPKPAGPGRLRTAAR